MEKAYDFKLNDSEGNEVALHDFLGQKAVVYFYPKDSTPGCTKQAAATAIILRNWPRGISR